MEFHPVTLIVGVVGTLALITLASTGLSCSIYVIDPDNHQYLEFLYQLAKLKRIC